MGVMGIMGIMGGLEVNYWEGNSRMNVAFSFAKLSLLTDFWLNLQKKEE